MPDNPAPGNCLNCGQAFTAPRPKFCPACGQESNVKPPTLGEFVQQFGGAYFSTEGALWRTLKLLLFKPGELTRLYLAGRRKHYVLPLRLYLTISVLTLLLMRLVASLSFESAEELRGKSATRPPGAVTLHIGPDADKTTNNLVIKLGGGSAGLKAGVFFCEGLPDWICRRIQRRVDIDPKTIVREVQQASDRFIGNVGAAMFLLLPSFALWLKLVYWNRRLRFTEHLVFALHVHAFWFLALALAISNVSWLVVVACTAVPWHTMVAMRRVYGGRRWPRFLRALVVAVLYGITLTIAVTAAGFWTLLS